MLWQANGLKTFHYQDFFHINIACPTMPEGHTLVLFQKIFTANTASLVIFHIIVVNVSNAMNVGIQETDHFEGVYPVICLFDNGKNSLFIFVNQETHQRLLDLLGNRSRQYHWIIQGKNEPSWKFCLKIRSVIQQQSIRLIYLNTVSKHHLWYALFIPFNQKLRSILTVHDVNCLFKEKPGYSPRKWVRYLGKKLLVARVSAFNTVSDTVRPYLVSLVKRDKVVYTVPGAFYEQKQTGTKSAEIFQIVVPGSIDPKRRDYDQVFQLLELVAKMPVKIIFLGGGQGDYAESIWSRCREANTGNITWFEKGIVDQQEFDAYLAAAHFIWVPSVVETNICGAIPETYGITKSSGNLFDIIKHATPFFYPKKLQVPQVLKGSGISYGSVGEIAEALSYYSSNTDAYIALTDEAEKASQQFTINNLRMIHAPLFD